jgi:hypothetical protein
MSMSSDSNHHEMSVAIRNCSMKEANSALFEIARVLVRLDQLASIIVNPNHSIM